MLKNKWNVTNSAAWDKSLRMTATTVLQSLDEEFVLYWQHVNLLFLYQFIHLFTHFNTCPLFYNVWSRLFVEGKTLVSKEYLVIVRIIITILLSRKITIAINSLISEFRPMEKLKCTLCSRSFVCKIKLSLTFFNEGNWHCFVKCGGLH